MTDEYAIRYLQIKISRKYYGYRCFGRKGCGKRFVCFIFLDDMPFQNLNLKFLTYFTGQCLLSKLADRKSLRRFVTHAKCN